MTKNKKIVTFAIVILTIITIVFLSFNKFNIQNTNTKTETKKYSKEELSKYKFVRIKYLITKKTKNNYSLKETFPKYFDDYLAFTSEYMLLEKKGDYYVASIKNQANKKVIDSITSYEFALNNHAAQMVNDAIFDKEKLEIKIPAKYYNQKYERIERQNSPVQVEFLSRMSEKDIQNLNVVYKSKKNINSTKKIARNGKRYSFSIMGSQNYTKKDIKIYLNGSKLELNDEFYNYSPKTGTIELNFSPILVDNIEVKYESKLKNIIQNIFTGNKVSAWEYRDDTSFDTIPVYKLGSKPSCFDKGNCGGDTHFPVYGSDYYPGPAVTKELQVAAAHFGGGLAGGNDVWNALSKDDFTLVNNSIDDVIVINPAINFGFDHNDTKYLGTSCIHISTPSGASNAVATVEGAAQGVAFPFRWKISDGPGSADSDGYKKFTVVVMLDPNAYYWSGVSSTSSVAQTLVAVMEFKYKDEQYGYIKIKKDYISDSNDTESNRQFYVYNAGSDGNCGTSDDSNAGSCETTLKSDGERSCYVGKNSDGTGSLKYGTYCIWEKNDGKGGLFDKSFVTTYSPNPVTGGDGYKYAKVTLSSTSDANSGGTRYVVSHVENRRRKYCYAARKTDTEGGGVIKGAFTFKTNISNESHTLSKSNAIATFGPYNYAEIYNYNDTQTLSDDTIKAYVTESASSSLIDTNINKKFWQLNNEKKVVKNSIKEANYSNGSWSCPSSSSYTTFTNVPNVRAYYCIKIIKKDTENNLLGGAKFTLKNGSLTYNSKETSTGKHSIFIEDNPVSYTAEETTVPTGYSKVANFTIPTSKIITLPSIKPGTSDPLKKADAKALCESDNTVDASGQRISDDSPYVIVKEDPKLVLNWFKTKENGTSYAGSEGAQFEVTKKGSTTKLKFSSGKTQYKDKNNVIKNCYTYNGGNNTTLVSDSNGEVCIIGIDNNGSSQVYTVKETKPLNYHTFGTYDKKDFTVNNNSINFAAFTANSKFVNYKTEFEFTKSVSSGDTTVGGVNWNSITTNELKKIVFNITNTNGTALSFIKTSEGVYEYAGNTMDKPSGTATTDLTLNGNRKFKVYHLPEGTYYVKEKKQCCDTSCNSCSGGTPCSGYYYPAYSNESSYKFTITKCSSSNATASSCTTAKAATQSLTNRPTKISFTKRDLYSYADPTKPVKFENNEEVNAFDKIKFRLKDENGNYVKLLKVGNTGTCKTTSSVATYRYVADESLLTAAQKANLTYDLYTCG